MALFLWALFYIDTAQDLIVLRRIYIKDHCIIQLVLSDKFTSLFYFFYYFPGDQATDQELAF